MRLFLLLCLTPLIACSGVQTGAGQVLDNAGDVIESGFKTSKEKLWIPKDENNADEPIEDAAS